MANPDDDDDLERYDRPVLPHERKADPGYRGGGLISAGFEFAIVVALFLFAGIWLDDVLGTEPWLTLVFSMGGIGAAMALLIRQVSRVSTDEPERKDPR